MIRNLLLLVSVFFLSVESFSASQKFIPQLNVVKPRVYLGDIMDKETPSELRRKGSDILIAQLSPGDEITLDSIEVSRLARSLGEKAGPFYIPSEITIRRLNKIDFFEQQIIKKVKRTRDADRVEMLEFRYPESAALASNDVHLALPDSFSSGNFNLPIFDTKDGQRRNIGWVSGRFRVFKNVPVASSKISIGTHLDESKFTFDERDITRESDVFPTREEILSSVARVPRQPGQMITQSDIRKEKLVKRGSPISGVIRNSDFEIKVSGLARESGYLGDLIKFYNPETKKVLSAQVVGPSLVEIKR